MIRNARQYRITQAQAAKLEQALALLTAESGQSAQIHPRLRQAQEDALRSQLTDLRDQLAAYDALCSRTCTVLTLESFEEFPRALIQARVATGMSQKELARRLGLKAQQIQRYEATEYARRAWHVWLLSFEPWASSCAKKSSCPTLNRLLRRMRKTLLDREALVTSGFWPWHCSSGAHMAREPATRGAVASGTWLRRPPLAPGVVDRRYASAAQPEGFPSHRVATR